MIDFYYEFPEGTKLLGEPIRYAIQRGYHPELSDRAQHLIRIEAYQLSTREWIENANGLTLVRENRRDVHKKCDPKIMTWIKLQAREI